MSRIRVLIKDPGQKAREWDIENDLKTLQHIVGGYIEVVTLGEHLAMIINEEGKLIGLPLNFPIHSGEDWIVGPAIFAGVDGEDFASLDDYQISLLKRHLEVSE